MKKTERSRKREEEEEDVEVNSLKTLRSLECIIRKAPLAEPSVRIWKIDAP